ncbi:unnamed protein product [Trichogramma brassicae]|uniref:Uncharacterized protein n=1 Tax=Trichogramma brassicae TaxID=86971 RepID=A0A6H5IVF6_9HYME|nr:unnamed protein product [Trichogramma brassicae]
MTLLIQNCMIMQKVYFRIRIVHYTLFTEKMEDNNHDDDDNVEEDNLIDKLHMIGLAVFVFQDDSL